MKTLEDIHPLLARVKTVMQEFPDRIAVIDKNGSPTTYGDLHQLVAYSRKILVRKGVGKGTRVLVAVPMSVELYAILLALFSLGGIAVFLDPWMKGGQMARIIRQVNPKVLVIQSRLRFLAWLLPATWKIHRWWTVDKLDYDHSDWALAPVSEEDIALITFTSGTGGNPKGADRSFGFLAAQMDALSPHLASRVPERDYTNFPIVGLADLALGNTVVVPDVNLMKIHQANPEELVRSLKYTQPTRLIISPSLLQKALSGCLQTRVGMGVHTVYTGGAPIPFSLIEKCLGNCPEIHFEAIFGSTEAEPIALCSFEEMRTNMYDPLKGVFVGSPEPITRCRIIRPFEGVIESDQLEEMICQEGETGELIVTGDHVNKSYFENVQAFRENKIVDEDGVIWHRTGDTGYFEQGQLYLTGRLHRMMNDHGRQIDPFPMEFYLERNLQLPDTGYVQTDQGEFRLYVGGQKSGDKKAIFKAFQECGYPLERILFQKKALSRDPRHRSKLDVHRLPNL